MTGQSDDRCGSDTGRGRVSVRPLRARTPRLQNRAAGQMVRAMSRHFRPPREEAARALCHKDGHPPDINLSGDPMWMSYLEGVDTVLMVVLGEDAWREIVEAERS